MLHPQSRAKVKSLLAFRLKKISAAVSWKCKKVQNVTSYSFALKLDFHANKKVVGFLYHVALLDNLIWLPDLRAFSEAEAKSIQFEAQMPVNPFSYGRLFFWTFPQKLKMKKTKTQAKKTQNSRIFRPKLKIPAIFSET